MDAATIASSLAGAIGANDNETTVTHWLSTGYPPLDYALSSKWTGGVAVGRITEIAGPPSAGKTALATKLMADAQAQGGIAAFMDHERSFSTDLAPRLGLDLNPGRFIYKKPRLLEDSFDMFSKTCKFIREKKLIAPDAPIAWVMDSLGAAVPGSTVIDSKGKEKGFADFSMHDNFALAKSSTPAFKAIALLAEELNVAFIFLNQVKLKPGVVYGDPRTTPGGEQPKFSASQRLILGSSLIKKGSGSDKEIIGAQVTGQVIKNKVARPFLSATWRFEFQPDGSGKFAFYRSLIDFLVEEKSLVSAGPRVEWKGNKFFAAELADRLEKDGAWNELLALLPKAYEPAVVAIAEDEVA